MMMMKKKKKKKKKQKKTASPNRHELNSSFRALCSSACYCYRHRESCDP